MLKELILENEKKIEVFDMEYFEANKNYPVIAALSALKTTNEIQKSYYALEDKEYSFNVLKLYAFLQSLFVSVDSLYALAFSLTKSKSFINLNKNQILRELKYIRNDVVGHPANRMVNSSTLAYCILDSKSVTRDAFSYDIYSGQGVERKCIDINQLVQSFYEEGNALLTELYTLAKSEEKNNRLTNLSLELLNSFDMDGNYLSLFAKLKQEYANLYPSANSNQHRFLWRVEMIEGLLSFSSENKDIKALVSYCIGLEIIKIYQLFSGKNYPVHLRKRPPFLVSSMYRFLKSNKSALVHIDKITDMKHPLMKASLQSLLQLAIRKKAKGAIQYLEVLENLYEQQDDDLLYAMSLPLKEYKKGR